MKAWAAKCFTRTTLVCAVFFFAACANDDLENAAAISSKKITLTKDRSYGVDIIYSDSAKVKAKGYAPILDKVTPSVGELYSEMPKGVKIQFFNNLLQTTGNITSGYAISRETQKITIFRKNVIVISDKITFKTEELIWDENKRLYSSPYGTVTTKDGDVITGTEFSAPQDFSSYKIIQASGSTYIKGNLTQ